MRLWRLDPSRPLPEHLEEAFLWAQFERHEIARMGRLVESEEPVGRPTISRQRACHIATLAASSGWVSVGSGSTSG